MGQFTQLIEHKQTKATQQIFVVKGLQRNLLGLPAIESLNLVRRVDTAVMGDTDVEKAYPKVFRGLGTLGKPYTIKLKEDAIPHALYTSRRVPLALREKVKRELTRMEKLGVISKVEEPTAWCAGMVAIPKSNGDLCICVDLKPLNESVLREVYPLSSVDETSNPIFKTGCEQWLLADPASTRESTANQVYYTLWQILLH